MLFLVRVIQHVMDRHPVLSTINHDDSSEADGRQVAIADPCSDAGSITRPFLVVRISRHNLAAAVDPMLGCAPRGELLARSKHSASAHLQGDAARPVKQGS
jgi:hypothetical protein